MTRGFIVNLNGDCLPKLRKKCPKKKLSANEALLEILMDADSAELSSDSELDLDDSDNDPNYPSSGDREFRNSRSSSRPRSSSSVSSGNGSRNAMRANAR